MNPFRKTALALLIPVLSGCASFDLRETLGTINQNTELVPTGSVQLAQTAEERAALEQLAESHLAQPLTQQSAVAVMLANSAEFQGLLAQHWQRGALAAQSGRISNPVFTFERMVKDSETEFGRLLTIGLMDLITLPARQQSAEDAVEKAKLGLAAEIVDAVNRVQMAWVDAVAANERFALLEKSFEVGDAGAELAKRLKSVGNFTTTERLRQQLAYSQNAIDLANARLERSRSHEALIRMLGLSDVQAMRLQLPEALDAQALQPISLERVQRSLDARLDVQIAKLDYEAALKREGFENLHSFTDIEYSRRHDTINDAGAISHKNGYELEIKVPLFDWGELTRDAIKADLIQRQRAYEAVVKNANSQMRERHVAYVHAHEIAQHYQDQILPMREALLEETTYNYNGMIVGVFDLLQSAQDLARAQVDWVDAKSNYAKAAISLASEQIGRPMGFRQATIRAAESAASGGH